MLTQQRVRTISGLAIPNAMAIGATMIMGVIDLVMVGRLGNVAIAAVGVSVFCFTLISSLVVGVSAAVQGIVARRRGEQSSEPESVPLNAGLMVALFVGVPLTALSYALMPWLMSVVVPDEEVAAVALSYLRIVVLSIVAVGAHAAFKGYWNGMERPRISMSVILAVSGLSILFNYLLIFGRFGFPEMGVPGAALGTTLAYFIGVGMHGAIVGIHHRGRRFWYPTLAFRQLSKVLALGLPATMQQFLYGAGYIVFFAIVAEVGTAELAAANVLVRVTLILVLLSMSLGVASATLVSKSLGEGDIEGASRWGWDCAKLGVIIISLLGLPLLFFPEPFLRIFMIDPETIRMSVLPLQMIAVSTGLGSLIYIFSYTLYSVGDGNRVVLVSFTTQWFIFLPGVWVVGPYLNYGLLEIWVVQIVYGCMATLLITSLWVQGRWKKIKI